MTATKAEATEIRETTNVLDEAASAVSSVESVFLTHVLVEESS
jgi:hypothetical protein